MNLIKQNKAHDFNPRYCQRGYVIIITLTNPIAKGKVRIESNTPQKKKI